MNALILRWRSRLARLFARPRTEPEPVAAPPRPAPLVVLPAAPPVAKAPSTAAIRAGGATTEAEAKQSFLETVQLKSLDAIPVALRAADPTVRERTLAGLGKLEQIPALQSLARGFMRALDRPDVAVDEVVATIEKDSALCVRVLRMANSVLVSSERRIEDLDTAVQMLGVARVRKAAQALFTLRDANRVAEGFDWRHLWIHALATTAIAEELELQLRSAVDSQIYLPALLHDVGKIVLSTLAPDDYREILVATWNDNGRLEDLERTRLGVDHREAGVLFARHSGLPEMVVNAIAHHDRPEAAKHHRFEVALIALANHLSKAYGLGFSGARLDASDGEFETHPAWAVVESELGGRPNVEAIATEMGAFVANLRTELKRFREGI